MKKSFFSVLLGLFVVLILSCSQKQATENDQYQLHNPFTVDYLTSNLRQEQPRLVLNADIEKTLRSKLQSDPVVKNIYEAIRLNAESIFDKPFL